ncbi:alpha/beta fold hydrolase [Shewanella sp.]|uniref:lipase family alpha/beta hydrolase n=1 Tax=Shewanella sp. TaxID=50422 RepID=UPI00260041D7|nr:alpha/beta fold hydrolase [Shewanella sp.]
MIVIGCTSSVTETVENQENHELVVLAHGLGRSDVSMWKLSQRLEDAGYLVCALNYDTIGQDVDAVLDMTTEQIDLCIAHAPKVHFVGHSLGGLVIRSYLQRNDTLVNNSHFGEVVFMGTPNKGSELADHFSDSWLMGIGGEISQVLVTGETSLGNQLEAPSYNVGIIAGTKTSFLTNNLFSGPNDGLVSVDSTKLDTMSDFVAIDVGHSSMRFNSEVAHQTIHYLKHGTFAHEPLDPQLSD